MSPAPVGCSDGGHARTQRAPARRASHHAVCTVGRRDAGHGATAVGACTRRGLTPNGVTRTGRVGHCQEALGGGGFSSRHLCRRRGTGVPTPVVGASVTRWRGNLVPNRREPGDAMTMTTTTTTVTTTTPTLHHGTGVTRP